jgi:hypothetical protein
LPTLTYQPPANIIEALRRNEASGDVIIVFEEWEEGGDGGHACIVGLFWRVDDALKCYHDTVENNITELNHQVYGHEQEHEDEAEWDVDVHIESMSVTGRPFFVDKESNNHGRLLWETLGHQVEITSVAVGVVAATDTMLQHPKLGVINEVGPLVLLAKVDDAGRKLATGKKVTRG